MTSVPTLLCRGAALLAAAAAGFWLATGVLPRDPAPVAPVAPGISKNAPVAAGAASVEPPAAILASAAVEPAANLPLRAAGVEPTEARGGDFAPRAVVLPGSETFAVMDEIARRAGPPAQDFPASRSSVAVSAGSPAGAAATSAAAPPPIVAPTGNVAIPVAFQPLPQDAKLTEPQRQRLAAIQDEFVKNIGGSDQEPDSPDYRARWRLAQWTADQQYRALFGVQAFLQRQIARTRADAAESADAP